MGFTLSSTHLLRLSYRCRRFEAYTEIYGRPIRDSTLNASAVIGLGC